MRIKNQAGFSLVQVLIAAGLIGVVSLGVAQLMVESSRVAKSNQSRIDQMVTISNISNLLLTEQKCSQAIKNQPYIHADASTNNGQEIEIKLPDGTIYKKNNPIPGSNLVFNSLKIKNSTNVTASPPPAPKVYNVLMTAQLESSNQLVGGKLFTEKEIANFFITVDGTNAIQSCSSQLGLAYLCGQIEGGNFDPVTQKCNVKPLPKDACEALNGVYDSKSKSCSQFKYKSCGKYSHGQTYSTSKTSGSCSGWKKTKSTVTKTYQCLDGTVYLTSSNTTTTKCPWSCFTGETLVRMYDGTQKPIKKIKPGDRVLGENGMINTVEEVETPDLGQRRLYSLNNDGNYFVTAEHPFKSTRGWVSMSPEATAFEHNFLVLQEPMTEGDYLHKFNSVPTRLDSIQSKKDDPKIKVYNLLLDGNNTYYANDYLVHNKDVK